MRGRKRVKLDKIKQLGCECFLLIPHTSYKNWGIVFGEVVRIKKGKDNDIVELNTGKGHGINYTRTLIARFTNPRKQIATLKIGVYTMALVETPLFQKGQKVNYKQKMCSNVLAFWSAYVPTKFDRQELEEEQNNEKMVEFLTKSENEELTNDFLSQFERYNNKDEK